jgi:glucokinase
VAGPVIGDWLSFTNHPWSFSIMGLTRDLGFDRLQVVNDFEAVALAVPHLGDDDRCQVGSGRPKPEAPIGIIGPGTGLGVASVAPVPGVRPARWITLPAEGGHVTLPAVTDREAAVVARLRHAGRAHVSAETLICGAGLATLYGALSALDGIAASPVTPEDVTGRALAGGDPVALEAVEMFCAMLGTIAGNLALTIGAHGGVYIAGGIVPKLGRTFAISSFRERFVAKGRMRAYLEPIPTFVITREFPAFLGLAQLFAASQP